jgi:hypothetical protein
VDKNSGEEKPGKKGISLTEQQFLALAKISGEHLVENRVDLLTFNPSFSSVLRRTRYRRCYRGREDDVKGTWELALGHGFVTLSVTPADSNTVCFGVILYLLLFLDTFHFARQVRCPWEPCPTEPRYSQPFRPKRCSCFDPIRSRPFQPKVNRSSHQKTIDRREADALNLLIGIHADPTI